MLSIEDLLNLVEVEVNLIFNETEEDEARYSIKTCYYIDNLFFGRIIFDLTKYSLSKMNEFLDMMENDKMYMLNIFEDESVCVEVSSSDFVEFFQNREKKGKCSESMITFPKKLLKEEYQRILPILNKLGL